MGPVAQPDRLPDPKPQVAARRVKAVLPGTAEAVGFHIKYQRPPRKTRKWPRVSKSERGYGAGGGDRNRLGINAALGGAGSLTVPSDLRVNSSTGKRPSHGGLRNKVMEPR